MHRVERRLAPLLQWKETREFFEKWNGASASGSGAELGATQAAVAKSAPFLSSCGQVIVDFNLCRTIDAVPTIPRGTRNMAPAGEQNIGETILQMAAYVYSTMRLS